MTRLLPADAVHPAAPQSPPSGSRSLDLGKGWDAVLHRSWTLPAAWAGAWDEFAGHHGDIGLFLRSPWMRLWWESFAGNGEPSIVVIREQGAVRGIVPVQPRAHRDSSRRVSLLASPTNDHSSYFGLLLHPSSARAAVARFVDAVPPLLGCGHLDLDQLSELPEGTRALVQELRARRAPVSVREDYWAPWIDVAGEWAALQAALPSRLRNTLRRRGKLAQSKGELRLKVVQSAEDLDELLDTLFDIEADSWKGREGSAIRCLPEVESYYRGVGHLAMAEGRLLLFLLTLQGEALAGSLCLRSGSTIFSLKAGHRESYDELSPGSLLQARIVEHLHGLSDVRVYNLLGSCDDWKMEWTHRALRRLRVTAYPASLAGRTQYWLQFGVADHLRRLTPLRRLRRNLRPAGPARAD